MLGLVGRKIGMTQVYAQDGRCIPVTAIQAGPVVITKVITKEKGGYEAIQVGYQDSKKNAILKSSEGYFKKRNITPKKYLREFRVSTSSNNPFQVGQELKVDIFEVGDYVDVHGTSIGKGFAGVVKRHHKSRGPESHGSMSHRQVGSIGASSCPSRVWPGQSMPGHMGNEKSTTQNLEVVRIMKDDHVILVKGAVPGSRNGLITLTKSLKKQSKKK